MIFLPAEQYHQAYLLIVLVLSIIVILQYRDRHSNYLSINKRERVNGFLITLFFTVFIGTRPISEVFDDMTQYYGIFSRWDEPFHFDWSVSNKLYDNLMCWFASMSVSPTIFYIIIAAIYFGNIAFACGKLFKGNLLGALVVYLGAFSTFSYGTNGIKAGAAASLFLVALAYRKRFSLSLLFLLLSLGFHHSMVVPVVAFLCSYIYSNPKFYYLFWVICLFLALFHVTYFQFLFAGMADEQGASYLLQDGVEWGGRSVGFRTDFVIYSAIPLLMGWYSLVKRRIKNRMYSFILCTYALTNAIWLLCMYASFTNRIAYLSWLMYPIVLIYPCFLPEFGKDRYRFFGLVASMHLAFTMFMFYIYK